MAVRKETAKKTEAKNAPAKQGTARKAPARNSAKSSDAKKTTATGEGANTPAQRPYVKREDLGAPVDVFFARHAPEQRAILEALDAMVKKAAPDARSSIKWGMPYYELKRGFCSLYTSPAYVGLNIMAPPDTLDDPEGRLEGSGKTMRHLKVRSEADLDEASILRWLKVAVAHHS